MIVEKKFRKALKFISFMKIAEQISKLSYDKKHQVGSILVKKDFTNINSVGYNGNYSGGPNDRDSLESGKSGFIHAEENALIKSNINNPDDYILFATMTPCNMCAKRIVNKEIKTVIALNKYENAGDTYHIFERSGVSFNYLNTLISKLYTESSLFEELYDFVNIQVVDKEEYLNLIEQLLYKQIDSFFGGDVPTEKLSILKIKFNYYGTIEESIKDYIDVFYKSIYQLI